MTDREMEEHEMKKLIALMLALLMAGSICFALAEGRTPPEDRKPTITELDGGNQSYLRKRKRMSFRIIDKGTVCIIRDPFHGSQKKTQ